MRRLILGLALLGLAAAPLAAHEHHPPHHGSLQVFGQEAAHLELLLDAKAGRLTAYALDGEAEEAVRLKQPVILLRITRCDPPRRPFTVALRAVANPLTGETMGDSSQFEAVARSLKGLRSFQGGFGDVTLRGLRFKAVQAAYPGGNEQEGK